MKHIAAIVMAVLICCTTAEAALQGREVVYRAGSFEMKGYLVHDDAIAGKRPGVLVVHEWWGLNDFARRRAEMLAELGYVAMAVDMYGNGRTVEHPKNAVTFSKAVRQNMAEATKRFEAAMQVLRNEPTADPDNIAAIGFCFGGLIVLEMARAGLDLEGVTSFHGTLITDKPAEPGMVKARVLVLNGAEDSFVTGEHIQTFTKEMENAGADYQLINYPGARHSFTNPDADRVSKRFGLPLAYNREADRQSWQALQEFLEETFK